MNAERVAELERLESSNNVSPESIIRAFVGPGLRAARYSALSLGSRTGLSRASSALGVNVSAMLVLH